MSEELRTYINPNAIEDGSIPISKINVTSGDTVFVTDSDFGAHTHSVEYETENVELDHVFTGTTGNTDAADSTEIIEASLITNPGTLPNMSIEYDSDEKALSISFNPGTLVEYSTVEKIVASSGHRHSYTPSGTIGKHTINMISEIVKTGVPNANNE